MRLCFLLLLSLCAALRVNGKYHCSVTKDDKSNVRMCAVKELLWGWLNVTNKTTVRAEKVMRNVTKLKVVADKVNAKAQASLSVASDVLERLKTNNNFEKIATVEQAVKMLEAVIAKVSTCHKKVIDAGKSANESKSVAVNYGYGAISAAAKSIVVNYIGEEISHQKTLEKIGEIKIGENDVCPEQLFVSRNLTEMADKLDVMENLDEWKNRTLKLLDTTYNQITQNRSTCHWTFNNGPEKFKGVRDAIEGAAEGLGNALKEFNAADADIKQAEHDVRSATREVQAVNTTMLDRFKQGGAMLCGMLGRHLEVDTQLRSISERLESTKQQTDSAAKGTADLLSNATGERKVVQSALDTILTFQQTVALSMSRALFASGNATLASGSVTRFEGVASLLVKNATREQEAIAEVDGQKKSTDEMFEHIKKQLIARLSETQLNASNPTADNCNKVLSGALYKPWEHVFDLALRINESALQEMNTTLGQLEAQVKLLGSNLAAINNSVSDITAAMSSAVQVRETAKTAAANAVADVLRSLMKDMCASSSELSELQKKNNELKGTADALKNKVSVESRHAEAAWKRDSLVSEVPQDVEDSFTHASKSVAVLAKHLQRVDAQYFRAVSELEKWLTKSDESDAKSYDVLANFVRGIKSNLPAVSSPNVCSDGHIDEVVASLLQRPDAMLKNVSFVVSLGELAAKVEGRVAAAREQMGKVASSADDAQAAVEEAIRRARNTAAGRRCTPLHRQLLNILKHIW
ncbi:hypothetical protein TRVL_07306 [Trypanosoma vivax]|nr:hypothetical protein TRVL_07306 [Trypanosoma vivax]